MNTSKKQNAKKERMSEIISKEILGATKFAYSLYPGYEKTYKEYTILNLKIERDTIFLELRNSKGKKERYTLDHFEEFLNRETGPFCSYDNERISFFSNHSKTEYDAKLAEESTTELAEESTTELAEESTTE